MNWWTRALAWSWNDPKGDVLVVLGGSSLEDGILGASSYWCSVYAARVWRMGGFQRIIVSGRLAAPAMRRFLIAEGVPAAAIQAEVNARSTREDALFVKPLLAGAPRRKVLLTSGFHMYRAYRAFRKAGLEVSPRPFPDPLKAGQSWLGRWQVFLELCAEEGKTAYYLARGWI